VATLEIEKLEHVWELPTLRLRELDTEECVAWDTGAVEGAIKRSIENSLESYAVYVDGALATVFGYMPYSFAGTTVRAWLLTTDVVDSNQFLFARTFNRVVGFLLGKYETVEVYVWYGHFQALKWLKRQGFRIHCVDPLNEEFVFMRKSR
jgi:hypothetical protein